MICRMEPSQRGFQIRCISVVVFFLFLRLIRWLGHWREGCGSSYDLLQSRDGVSPSRVYALINSSFQNRHTSAQMLFSCKKKKIQ